MIKAALKQFRCILWYDVRVLFLYFEVFFCNTSQLRCRWIDNIKMDLLEIGLSVVDWIGLAQDRYRWRALVTSVMNLRVP
jgi:hypothetical protein